MAFKTKIILWLLFILAFIGVLGVVWFIKNEFFSRAGIAAVSSAGLTAIGLLSIK